MVHFGSTCLRRLADGKEPLAIRFGRLLRHPNVTVERIIAGWSEQTVAAVSGRHVLAIQDRSDINFRTRDGHTRGLGVIGKGVGRGLLLHPMLAVDAATHTCLGLVSGALWSRAESPPSAAKTKVNNARRPLEEKESRHWIATAQQAKPVLAGAALVTMIADREADFYQMWTMVPEAGVHILGRAFRDRPLAGGGQLNTAAAAWPGLGTRRILIREREGRPEREADLELRAGQVTVLRPKEIYESGLPDQVMLTLVELTEPAPPAGAEPVMWRLLTTHAVPDAATAWQIVDWYRCRWIIEQFFRTLKQQGLQIEDSQVETADRLLKLVAIAARAAVIIMQLTQVRDAEDGGGLAAAEVFSVAEIETLKALGADYAKRAPASGNSYPFLSLAWAAWIIARLGGWSGYRGKARPPGPITFKNGLLRLQTLAQGWALREKFIP
jgi:hypothetical protein